MLNSFVYTLLRFIIILLLQVLVFNHIHIMGYATPLVYIYFVLLFPSDAPRYSILLWSFALGIIVDCFSNTPGLAAAEITAMALLQPNLLKVFSPRDEDDAINPSIHSMGFYPFLRYIIIGTLIHEIFFFVIESFSFFNWKDMCINIAGSSVLTIFIILAIDSIKNRGKHRKVA